MADSSDKEQEKEKSKTQKATDFAKTAGGYAAAGMGAVGSGIASAARKFPNLQTSTLTFLSVIALLNLYLDYRFNFEISPLTITLHIGTGILFALLLGGSRKSWQNSMYVAFFEFILPWVVLSAPSILLKSSIVVDSIGILLLIPYWLVYCFYLKFEEGLQSKVLNVIGLIVLGIALILMFDSIGTAINTPNYVVNQQAVLGAKKVVVDAYDITSTAVSNNWKTFGCVTTSGKSYDDCRKVVLGTTEDLEKYVRVDNSLDTGFTMAVSEFIKTGYKIAGNNPVRTAITAENNLNKPIFIEFGCGILERSAGIPNPDTKEISKGRLLFAESSISCDVSKTSRRGTPEFYFNMTAKNIISSGRKEILVVSEETKNAVLEGTEGYGVLQENFALRESNQFGDLIKARESFLNPQTGKDDLVQLIIKDGLGVDYRSESPLVYGVKPASVIGLSIFLKNTGVDSGTGIATKINAVRITPPEGFEFDVPNCGFDPTQFQSTRILKDENVHIASCHLVTTSDIANPNQLSSKVILGMVDYDYTITKKQTIGFA